MTPGNGHDAFVARDAARSRARRAAHELLLGLEAHPAPAAHPDDAALMRSLDSVFAQVMRAARHTSGSVRAYASLIEDGYAHEFNAATWAARIGHAAGDLDDFASRMGAMRMCAHERVTSLHWGEVMARVAARCGSLGSCTIEVIDRAPGVFRQRGEFAGRVLFHALRNAVEATPRGGIVRMRADHIKLEATNAVHLRITDSGAGIDPALDIHSIWKPFVTAKADHAGLGLAYIAAAAPLLGMVNGIHRDKTGTTIHTIIFEEGELSW